MLNIAVIGSGLAGLTAARQLQHAGHHVTVYEKAMGVSGRMSTRRQKSVVLTMERSTLQQAQPDSEKRFQTG
jgi:predicted NAD/FAD-dependent oxidoreductase